MATFQIDTPFLENLKDLIQEKEGAKLKRKFKPMHYADIAEIIQLLSQEEAIYVVKLLDSETTADALAEVDPDIRESILVNLSAKEISLEVAELDTDDAISLAERFSKKGVSI